MRSAEAEAEMTACSRGRCHGETCIYILKTIIDHSVACVIMRGFIFSPGYELEWGFKQKADLVKEERSRGKNKARSSEGNSEQKQKTVRGVLLPSLIFSEDSLHFSVLRCELRHVWAALSGASWKAVHRRSSSSETRQTSSDRTSADRSLVFVIRRRFPVSLICWCSDDEHSFGPEVAPLSSFRPTREPSLFGQNKIGHFFFFLMLLITFKHSGSNNKKQTNKSN